MFVLPPEEWLAKRRSAGVPTEVGWRLLKQLPGQRAAGNRFLAKVNRDLTALGWERCEMCPNVYRFPGTRLVIDSHVDDWHGVGRVSEIQVQLPRLRDVFRLKATDAICHGTYSHLKRVRMRHGHDTYIRAETKHVEGVLLALGLEKASGSKTPHLPEERPTRDPPLGSAAAAL